MSNEDMQAMASLFRKKAAVMAALEGGMSKDGKNDHFNYKFMTASSIKATVGQLLARHGLALKMSGVSAENMIITVELKGGAIKQTPILRIQFAISLCDVDTGASDESYWFGEAGASDDKAASKCATSALKYFLISNLLIADKEEDDRDTDNQKARPQRPERPTATNNHAHAPVEQKASAKNESGAHIASVLPEYEPFMAADAFEDMKASLRAQVKFMALGSQAEARRVIEDGWGKFIDMDTKRAADKEIGE